jgi:hypothetical protein
VCGLKKFLCCIHSYQGVCRYPEDRVPRVQAPSHDKRQGGRACPRVPGPAPASRLREAPGPRHVPTALAPVSRLRAAPGAPRVPVAPVPASRLRAALGPPRVPAAPTLASWLRAALRAPRVPVATAPASRLGAALGGATCCLGYNTRLLCSGQPRSCHVSRGRALQAASN